MVDYSKIFTLEQLNIIKYILCTIISTLSFVLIIKTEWGKNTKDILKRSMNNIEKKLQIQRSGIFSFDRIDDKLKCKGIYYITEDKITPGLYIVIKVLFLFLGILIGLLLKNIILIIFLSLLGFLLFDIVMIVSNMIDNEEMLSDIKNMFDTLKIQTRAGVYLSQSLSECYMIIENKRLKYELLKMTNKIITTNDIITATNEFNSSFDNEYINILCLMILQSQENGYSLQMMDDLTKQISDMQTAINIKLQEKLDRKIQLFELGIFLGLIAICIYSMVTEFAQVLFDF